MIDIGKVRMIVKDLETMRSCTDKHEKPIRELLNQALVALRIIIIESQQEP